jgi:hypothetical protein
MTDDNPTLQNLVDVAATTELRHFAVGALFAPKFTTAEGLSDRERGEVAETLVAWKAADKALSDYRARRVTAWVERQANPADVLPKETRCTAPVGSFIVGSRAWRSSTRAKPT